MTVESLEDFRARAGLARRDRGPEVPSDPDARFAVPRRWQKTLSDAAWLGLAWSREAGGGGLTHAHQLVFVEELVRARAPSPSA